MSFVNASMKQAHFGQTQRRDWWWLKPLVVFLGLSTFIGYSTWAAFQGAHYHWGPYLKGSRREVRWQGQIYRDFLAKQSQSPIQLLTPVCLKKKITIVPSGQRQSGYKAE